MKRTVGLTRLLFSFLLNFCVFTPVLFCFCAFLTACSSERKLGDAPLWSPSFDCFLPFMPAFLMMFIAGDLLLNMLSHL